MGETGGKMRERFQRQVSNDGGEGDEPSDSFMGSGSESGDEGDGESMEVSLRKRTNRQNYPRNLQIFKSSYLRFLLR